LTPMITSTQSRSDVLRRPAPGGHSTNPGHATGKNRHAKAEPPAAGQGGRGGSAPRDLKQSLAPMWTALRGEAGAMR
ncbi:MAG: hypothetical protein OXU63_18165, partial [Acidobacteriota bacterium]|nr:hypothetical protein [Acidobacteriota bacterium]